MLCLSHPIVIQHLGTSVVPKLCFVSFAFSDPCLIGKSIGPRVCTKEQLETIRYSFCSERAVREMWLQVRACLHPAGFLLAEPEYDSELHWVLASNIIWCLLRTVETHSAMTNPYESLSLEWLIQLLKLKHRYLFRVCFYFFFPLKKYFWI